MKQSEEYATNTITLKIIIVGDKGTGKTSIIKRFIENIFENNSDATIVPTYSKKIIKSNSTNFTINLWDIPGQDMNAVVTRTFAQDTQGIIFNCEVNNINSRESLKNWKESLESLNDIEAIPKILIENKCDLLGAEDSYNNGTKFLKESMKKLGCLNCFRTSALNGYNIDEALNFLINEIIKDIKEEEIQDYNKTKLKNSTHSIHSERKKKAACC